MKKIIAFFALFGVFPLTSTIPAYAERDLETGVFLSRDPAGFVDGPNLYAYVKQNPWTSFDPLGLAEDTGDGTRILTDSSGYRHVLGGNADYPNPHYRNALEVSLNDNNPENLDRAMTTYVRELRENRAEAFALTIMAEAEDPEGARNKWAIIEATAMSWGAGPRSPRSRFRPKGNTEPTQSSQKTQVKNETIIAEDTYTKNTTNSGGTQYINKLDYSHIPNPQKVGPGMPFKNDKQRKAIFQHNKDMNNGVLTSDQSGVPMVPHPQNKKGVVPPSNGAQIDHSRAAANGGTNESSNARVISREENIRKSDN